MVGSVTMLFQDNSSTSKSPFYSFLVVSKSPEATPASIKMVFNGPGIYAIVPFGSPEFSINSQGGSMNPGEVVKTYARGDREHPSDNALFQAALVKGTGNDAEYLLINVRNGYYLTATEDRTITSCQQRSPRDPSVRWKIISSPSTTDKEYPTFIVNSVIADRGQLNVAGDKLGGGVDILAWPIENGGNTKFYFDSYP